MSRIKSFNFFIIFFVSLARLDSGMANSFSSDDTSDEMDVAARKSKITSIIVVSLILCLVLLVILLSVFLYKRWQQKKKENHHARLMKLFGPDEELDEELSGNNIV
ncbi:hypothetical protein SASPL_134556 [Salvia splendens]|uniref:Uncharacterized protein n=1 Tax=Salvia splendens TaxID=180675 RepID=A0A8X8X6A9_SALSN|nr:hypothetical protein SASPL_134556 [Salvia splendens]